MIVKVKFKGRYDLIKSSLELMRQNGIPFIWRVYANGRIYSSVGVLKQITNDAYVAAISGFFFRERDIALVKLLCSVGVDIES